MPITIPIPDITSPSSTGFADETVRSLREVSRQALSAPDAARLRVPLANSAETIAGRSAAKAVTPAALKAALPTLAPRPPAATQDQAGVVRLSRRNDLETLDDSAVITARDFLHLCIYRLHVAVYLVYGEWQWTPSGWRKDPVTEYPVTKNLQIPDYVTKVHVYIARGTGGSSSFGKYLTKPPGHQTKSGKISVKGGEVIPITLGAGQARSPGRKKNAAYMSVKIIATNLVERAGT